MADEADYATETLERWGSTMEAARQAERQKELSQEGSEHCDECGCEIPEERRIKYPHVRLCVPCKAELEEDAQRRARLQGA